MNSAQSRARAQQHQVQWKGYSSMGTASLRSQRAASLGFLRGLSPRHTMVSRVTRVFLPEPCLRFLVPGSSTELGTDCGEGRTMPGTRGSSAGHGRCSGQMSLFFTFWIRSVPLAVGGLSLGFDHPQWVHTLHTVCTWLLFGSMHYLNCQVPMGALQEH